MVAVVMSENAGRYPVGLGTMFRDRKRIFVDALGWDLPVVDGLYERDQYDGDQAIYLLATDPADGTHLASLRLLPSTGPHLLVDHFADLCENGVPVGSTVFEMTRYCVSPKLRDRDAAWRARQMLSLGLVEFALLYGIDRLTGTTSLEWLPSILSIGWDVDVLGPAQRIGDQDVVALAINVSPATLQLMRGRSNRQRPVLTIDLSPQMAEAA